MNTYTMPINKHINMPKNEQYAHKQTYKRYNKQNPPPDTACTWKDVNNMNRNNVHFKSLTLIFLHNI